MSATDPSLSAPHAGFAAGDVVADKYRIERIIGQGAMGTVYLARHIDLDEPVALKVLLPAIAGNPQAVSRFLREAKASARIKGEHVARVSDAGRIGGGDAPFMVMEYLEGRDLGSVIEQDGALPVDLAVEYILQAADAVAQAHALGIIHRDLKPQNLFLTKRADGSPLIKVLDFGISKAEILGNATFGVTNDGTLLGSPAYMSPEQIASARNVSPQADLWSLGVILYELLTGGLTPFDADTIHGLLLAITISEAKPIREHRADVPEYIAEAIDACLCKVPSGRPADVGDLALRLVAQGNASQKMRAERVTATLLTVAADRAAASERLGNLPTAPVTLPLASGPSSSGGMRGQTAPLVARSSGASSAGEIAPALVRLGPIQASPRTLVGIAGGLVAGILLAIAFTRGGKSDVPTTRALHTASTHALADQPLLADSAVPSASASASESPSGRGSSAPLASGTAASSHASKGNSGNAPAPLKKVERGLDKAGRFLDCKIAGNCH